MIAGSSPSISSTSQIGDGVIVNADINANAGIAASKMAAQTANRPLISDANGFATTEATLAPSRGGTGVASPTAKGLLRAQGASAMDTIAPGSAGQVLVSDGTDWAPGSAGGGFLASATTDIVVNNTTTETDLATISLAGNTLSTNKAVRLTMWISRIEPNSPTTDTITFALKYGSTTICSVLETFASGIVGIYQGKLEFIVIGAGATNAQEGEGILDVFVPGHGTATDSILRIARGTAAEDSTGALTLKATVKWNNAGSGSFPGFTCSKWLIEKIT